MKRERIRILYFIQLPPPVHGVSIINRLVYDSPLINENIDRELLEIRFSDKLTQLRKWRPGKILKFIRLIWLLAIKMKRRKPDYIYFSIMAVGKGFVRDLFFVLIMKIFGVKTIFHIHNRGIKRHSGFALMSCIYRFVFNNSMVIHLSDRLMETEINELNPRNCTRMVIPNGLPSVVPEPEQVKTDGTIRLLFLSNLFAGKGLEDLMHVFFNLTERYSNLELIVAGAFPTTREEKRINKLIACNERAGKVKLIGPVYGEKKQSIYHTSDIFVFPTFFSQECFPLVILEAMQTGLPVVATKEGAIPEIITDGVTGFLIDARDTVSLRKKLSLLIESPELRNKLGENARQLFEGKYTSEHFEKRMRAFYDTYL